jgi:hypothetical protein
MQLMIEQENLQYVTLNDRRNVKATFVRTNQSHAGLNNITNRLRTVTNMLHKSWLDLSRETFKLKCKKFIIQTQLLLLS